MSAAARALVGWSSPAALAAAATILLAAAQEEPAPERALAEFAQPLDPRQHRIGEIVPDLAFKDLAGTGGRLSDFADRKAVVVVVRDVGCPVSRKYGLRTAEIERAMAPRGVAFLYVNTSSHDSEDECRAEAAEYGFTGRYVRDPDGRFGAHLGVRTTTDVFVLDGDRRLRYRGAIDDQIGRGATRAKVKREYLKEALEAVLKGERVADPAMTAPGCTIGPFGDPPSEPDGPTITWHGRVEWIVQEKCQRCHRPGGAGPFELIEAEDVAGRAAMIRQVVLDGDMPPWYATRSSGPFVDDLGLTDPERLDLLRWLQSDRPTGDPREAPPPRAWPTGWLIGEPDLVVEIPEPVEIPATGVVDYLLRDSPTHLDRDVWLQAIQILCENPGVCHHVLAIARYPGEGRQEFIDSYLPGKEPTIHPEGMAALLRKGAVIHWNLHYTPNGKPARERTKIGFKFAKSPPALRVHGRIVRTYGILIPPGEPRHEVVLDYKMRFDATLRRLIPHMHLRGKAAKVELLFPDGTTQVPLDLPRWHPDWQFAYELSEPIELPKGTVIRSTSIYDNSRDNPFNPDPTKQVRQGPQIWDEMGGVFVEWTRPVAAGAEPREPGDSDDDEPPGERARDDDGR